jgi:catalase
MWYPTQAWDYIANHPEGFHQATMMFTDRGGTPLSFRHMHGYGCNTFSFINAHKERFWVKFHLIAQNGAKGLPEGEARMIAGEDPNFLSRDLRSSIDEGNFPKWKFCCQIMNEEAGYRNPWTFDCTKVWKHKDFPLIDIGILELNRNPINYFSEVEQVAFSPANVVPGIGFSPDKLLQGRLLIYEDAQHHRIGPNFKQLPINAPHGIQANTMNVGGNMNLEMKNKFPHYYPNSFGGYTPDEKYLEPPLRCDGPVGYYPPPLEGTDEDYYFQAGDLFRLLKQEDQHNLCHNVATSLAKVEDKVVAKVLPHLAKIDPRYRENVERLLKEKKEGRIDNTGAPLLISQLDKLLHPLAKKKEISA